MTGTIPFAPNSFKEPFHDGSETLRQDKNQNINVNLTESGINQNDETQLLSDYIK